MRWLQLLMLPTLALLYGCAGSLVNRSPVIGDFERQEDVNPQITEVSQAQPRVSFSVDRAALIKSYRDLVAITPQGEGYGKELQRLADLELENSMDTRLSDQQKQAEQGEQLAKLAIERYQQYLKNYPDRPDNDLVLYQLARAYAIDAKPQQAQAWMDKLVAQYPASRYRDEVQFRRGEYLFVAGQYAEAGKAYGDVVAHYPNSQYYDKALYKLGWTQFKLNHYIQALDSYMQLLDVKQQQGQLGEIAQADGLSRADQELLQDVLRVVSLAFSYLPQRQPINQYFNHVASRPYEPLLYKNLANLYLAKERVSDATNVYFSYGEKYPFSRYRPLFHQLAIKADSKAGFSNLELAEKKNFVKLYNKGTAFWRQQNPQVQAELQPLLTRHIFDIATHYHALARASKKSNDYQLAASWYRSYLHAFPQDTRAAEVNFLLAESLFDSGHYRQSITEYEKTAYFYAPGKNSAEAAYAALLAYNRLISKSKNIDRQKLDQQFIKSALNFAELFPQEKRAAKVLLNATQKLYQQKAFAKALASARRLLKRPALKSKIKRDSWLIVAQSGFQLKDYATAEKAYRNLIKLTSSNNKKQLKSLRLKMAASIYKQGEVARTAGSHQQAAAYFMRASKIVPGSKTSIIAEYDAATEYMTQKDWKQAIVVLQAFRKKYPAQKKWRLGVSQKLALAYSEANRLPEAASEMLMLARLSPKKDQRDLLWQSAQLYEKTGNQKKALALYKRYIKQYPQPLARSIELRQKLAQYYQANKDSARMKYWLKEIVKADARAGKQRSDRSRYLAARAKLQLAQPLRIKYAAVKLTRPLKKSLKRKKNLMKQAIDAYRKAAKYQVEEVTTSATYFIAEIYRGFANALLKSERPKKLDADALEEYNYMLEDQAYPFEEKAIKIHQGNLSRMARGSYDDAIKNSLRALAKLMPFRYAKAEITDDYVE